MKLKDLKKKATTSEMALIDTVEKLVRGEYDLELLKKDIHDKLKKDIYNAVEVVMKKHSVFSSVNLSSPYASGMSFYEYNKLRDVLYEVGDAIRLELKEDER